MTTEEYEKEYLAHVKALGLALHQEIQTAPVDPEVKKGIVPIHVGVQAAVSEINALVQVLINKDIITQDEYREAVLKQLDFQKEIVLSRLAMEKKPS